VVGVDGLVLLGLVHAGGEQFLAPLVLLHGGPFLDEVLRFGADFDFQGAVEYLDAGEEADDAQDLLARLEFKVAEGQQPSAVVRRPLEVLYCTKLVQESLHRVVRALLRYIFDEHFLPHLLFRSHFICGQLLGTPSGLTVMLPPWVIIGVIVTGSSTKSHKRYPRPDCTCSCEGTLIINISALL
jgi:hypothetical protein